MLVVIAIIMILAAILLPAASTARQNARKREAKSFITALGNSLKAYEAEYGTLPMNDDGTVPAAILVPAQLRQFHSIMIGSNVSMDGTVGRNPRNRVFLHFKDATVAVASNWYDPWKRWYQIQFDDNADNQITVFTSAGAPQIRGRFAIWSQGPDQTNNLASMGSPLNKDNITSW